MSSDVLDFIDDFYNLNNNSAAVKHCLRNQFMNGYCYYFAYMLKTAFNRGEVCLAYPLGHIVWVDTDGIPYDADGVNNSECSAYIPESFVGDMMKDFRRVRGEIFNATSEQIHELGIRWNKYNMVERYKHGEVV